MHYLSAAPRTIDFRKVEEFFPSIFDSALSLHQFNMASSIMVE